MAINRFRGGRYSIDDIRSRFQTVALDNEYQVFFSLNNMVSQEAIRLGIDKRFLVEDLGLYVADAVLPGSSFADVEVAGDRQGITERNAFSRIYDDVTFSLYIDRNYEVLRFFESWIQFINPLYSSSRGLARNQITKFNYPDDYKCEMVITKFNKDLKSSIREIGFADGRTSGRDQISYRFFRAWPYSLASTPVSYQGMNMLRCNITFRYDRYVVSEVTYPKQPLAGDTIRNITEFDNRPLPTRPSADSRPPEPSTTAPQRLPDEPRSEQGNSDPETTGGQTIDTNAALPNPGSGNKLREDLAIWALSNQDMIKNVGTGKQKDLLTEARSLFPKNSKERRALKERALQGTYLIPGENGNLTSANRPLPRVNF
tara:strand:+ start:3675 stop:4790 length:1116 start_codon:yes stop_codon:yes gene_type:complete